MTAVTGPRPSRPRSGRDVMRRGKCALVSPLLYPVEAGERVLPAPLRRHFGSCLTCQAAASRQRRVLSGLRSMREATEPPPPALAAAAFPSVSGPSPAPATPSRRGRAAVVSTVSMVAAAAVAAALAGLRARAQAAG